MDKELFDALSCAYEYVSLYADDLAALFGMPYTEDEQADLDRVRKTNDLILAILKNYGYTPTETPDGYIWNYKKPEAYQPFLSSFPIKKVR